MAILTRSAYVSTKSANQRLPSSENVETEDQLYRLVLPDENIQSTLPIL